MTKIRKHQPENFPFLEVEAAVNGVLMARISLCSGPIVFDLCDRYLYLAWKVSMADHGNRKQKVRCRLNILWI